MVLFSHGLDNWQGWMSKRCAWQEKGIGELRCNFSTETAKGNLDAYLLFLENYRQSSHHAFFTVTVTSGVDVVSLQIAQHEAKTYASLANQLNTLPTISKLNILKEVLSLERTLGVEFERVMVPTIHQIWINQRGNLKILPPTDLATSNYSELSRSVLEIGAALFDMQSPLSKDAKHDNINSNGLPVEVRSFLADYPFKQLNQFEEQELSSLESFVFFQSWIYCDAVRVAMADDELSLAELNKLRQISTRLGLSAKQAENLEEIAMLSTPMFADFWKAWKP